MAAEATGGDNLAERVSALETYLLGDGENLFQKCVGEHRRICVNACNQRDETHAPPPPPDDQELFGDHGRGAHLAGDGAAGR